MTISEKAAFFKGLVEGSELHFGEKEQKVVDALIDLVCDMAQTITKTTEDVDDLYDSVEEFYEELNDIEDDLDELFDDEDYDDDEQLYDVECQNCHEIICVDGETLIKGGLECPNCGEKLEFDFDDFCSGDCGGCGSCGGCGENDE